MGMLSGKVAIVTGAGNGIGRGEAVALAAHGSAVVVNDLGGSVDGAAIDGERFAADAVVAMIRERGGRAVANYSDVSDWEAGARMVDQAVEELGGLDILINNAGINRRVAVTHAAEDDVDTLTRCPLQRLVLNAPSHREVLVRRARCRELSTPNRREYVVERRRAGWGGGVFALWLHESGHRCTHHNSRPGVEILRHHRQCDLPPRCEPDGFIRQATRPPGVGPYGRIRIRRSSVCRGHGDVVGFR